jgi:quinone-modifying oxidoreductase subunit QmoC
LWVIFGVGLTGMGIVFIRLSGVAVLAYITYFIHLTLVFFLLWYMPYSKFAHMIYRFLGLTFLKMHGRGNKHEVFGK